jgi:hypothetical protein
MKELYHTLSKAPLALQISPSHRRYCKWNGVRATILILARGAAITANSRANDTCRQSFTPLHGSCETVRFAHLTGV